MEKYLDKRFYVPSIEEFHVGFEYERNDGAQWAKKTSDIYDLMDVHTMLNKQKLGELAKDCETYEDFVEKTGTILPKGLTLKSIKLNPNIYSERIRVKHLNQEDIESLGETVYKDGKIYFSNNELPPLAITFNGGVSSIIIEGIISKCVLFMGTIKNKSELKRILKQIGVESN